MKDTYRLSLRAAGELEDIFLYGLETFGPRQAEQYARDFERCLELLAASPRMGRPAPRLGTSVRRHEHASHIVLYEETERGVLILAIVHARHVAGLEL